MEMTGIDLQGRATRRSSHGIRRKGPAVRSCFSCT